jgi:glutamate formiminotransferase
VGRTPVVVECVPNVSEGRDSAIVERLAATIRRAGARLANVHMDPDHHRSVFSFLGGPDVVRTAALALAADVLAAVDLRNHRGSHPRIGALDVLPFVPIDGVTMDDVVALARHVGHALAERHDVPVYFYGFAAVRDQRRRLPDARRGGYEALATRLATQDGEPDAGPARFDPRRGAILVGARNVLVAYNVWLESTKLEVATAIARSIREAGGCLPAVQALGVPLTSRGIVQVSMNLLDYQVTSIPVAFDAVVREAGRRGVAIRRGELVGLAPRAAFAGRAPASVGLSGFTDDLYLDTHVAAALRSQ